MIFRAFVKDSAVYGLGGVLTRALSVLLLPFYTRALSPRDYGIIELLLVCGTMAVVVIALEISQGLARHLPEASSAQERAEWASTALWFTVGAMLVLVVGSVVCARPASRLLFGAGELAGVFCLGAVSTAVASTFYLCQSVLQWRRQAKEHAAAGFVTAASAILATIVLVLWLRLGVVGFIVGQIIGYLAGFGLASWFARAELRPVFSWTKCRRMLAFSLPLVPASMAVYAAVYVDRLAIRHFMTLSDLGIYGVAYRVASPISLLAVGFQGALVPLVVAHYRSPETPAAIARIFRYFVTLALVGCVGLSVFAREIVALIAAPRFGGAAVLVPLLAPALLLPAMYGFAPGLFLAKRPHVQARVSIAGAAVNTTLNVLLVPVLGMVGAALATVLAAGLTFAALMALSQREYPVPHGWPTIAAAIAVAAVTILLGGWLPTAGAAVLVLIATLWIPTLVLGWHEVKLIVDRTRA